MFLFQSTIIISYQTCLIAHYPLLAVLTLFQYQTSSTFCFVFVFCLPHLLLAKLFQKHQQNYSKYSVLRENMHTAQMLGCNQLKNLYSYFEITNLFCISSLGHTRLENPQPKTEKHGRACPQPIPLQADRVQGRGRIPPDDPNYNFVLSHIYWHIITLSRL